MNIEQLIELAEAFMPTDKELDDMIARLVETDKKFKEEQRIKDALDFLYRRYMM